MRVPGLGAQFLDLSCPAVCCHKTFSPKCTQCMCARLRPQHTELQWELGGMLSTPSPPLSLLLSLMTPILIS